MLSEFLTKDFAWRHPGVGGVFGTQTNLALGFPTDEGCDSEGVSTFPGVPPLSKQLNAAHLKICFFLEFHEGQPTEDLHPLR